VVLQGAESGEGQGKITGVWDGESNEGSAIEMIESFTAGEVLWGMLERDWLVLKSAFSLRLYIIILHLKYH
jgi:hypothetical protein